MRDPVEISCKVLEVRDKSVKVTDGTTKEFPDKHTGELIEREVWYFLPLSQIECEDELEVGATVTITMSEWLATEKGLI